MCDGDAGVACHGGRIVVLPNLHARADGESIALHREPYWLAESAEMSVEAIALRAQHDELAGLICGDEHRGAKFLQDRWKVVGMNAAQRRRVIRVRARVNYHACCSFGRSHRHRGNLPLRFVIRRSCATGGRQYNDSR